MLLFGVVINLLLSALYRQLLTWHLLGADDENPCHEKVEDANDEHWHGKVDKEAEHGVVPFICNPPHFRVDLTKFDDLAVVIDMVDVCSYRFRYGQYGGESPDSTRDKQGTGRRRSAMSPHRVDDGHVTVTAQSR